MKPLALTLSLLLVGACSWHSPFHTQDAVSPSVEDTLHTFSQALGEENIEGILGVLADDVTVHYGVDGTGKDAFIQTWRDPEPEPWLRLMNRVDFLISQGGVQLDETTWQFPYWTHITATHVDPDRIGRILTPQSAQMAMIAGADWARADTSVICDTPRCTPGPDGTVTFLTPEGDVGVMTPDHFLSTIGTWRMTLEYIDGEWKVASIVAGD